ncbi:MAG: hypothetical protein QOC93_1384 [Actinomycetota bacterium]|jgi:hypothetical protein|nr:hypothetical protein [Cryptosporangiaceae bacterium]MDQ1676240.1 hypothetical protein [Actinomycetota bacterium]
MFRRYRGEIVGTLSEAEAELLRHAAEQMLLLLGAVAPEEGDPPPPEATGDPFEELTGLGTLPSGPPSDPALERLFPDGYREDPDAAAELRRFTEDDLRAGKVERLKELYTGVPAGGGDVYLSHPAADVWLRALTDLRLVLGVRLDIEADTDPYALAHEALESGDEAMATSALLYHYAGALSQTLVDALLGED